MGGKAALIFVVGFGVIFGIIAYRMQQMETRAIGNMSSYVESTNSHNVALAGMQVGLSRLAHEQILRDTLEARMAQTGPLSVQVLAQETFTSGPFVRASYKVALRGLDDADATLELRSTAAYPVEANGIRDTLRDTAIVELKRLAPDDFRILGLMLGFGGADDTWITGDSMKGRIHFNGRLTVYGSPVFVNKVTVSGGFSPKVGTGTNQAIILDGDESGGVRQIALPVASDLLTDLMPCGDILTTPVSLPITSETSLEFVGGDPAVNMDGVVLVRNGLHNFGRGVYRSTNRGDSWLKRDSLLTYGNVYAMGVGTGTNVFAGTLGGGFYGSTNSGTAWSVNSLSGNNVRAIVRSPSGKVYAGTQRNGVYRSTNSGTSWALNTLSGQDVRALAMNTSGHLFAAVFIAVSILNGVYKSTDSAATWTNVLSSQSVTSLAINSAGSIFAGTAGNGVYVSTNGGTTWTNPWSGQNVTALTIDTDGKIFAGTAANGVYRSQDNGTTWSATTALPNSMIRSLLTRTSSSPTRKWLFVGTKGGGVFRSTDAGDGWTGINTGLKNWDVTALIANTDASDLYAGTNSDTLFINDLSVMPNGVIYATANLSIRGKVDTRPHGSNVGISIGTNQKIYIDGDITYEIDPRVDITSDDMLGIVALNEIIVYNAVGNAPNDTSKKTWTIHGIMCSLNETMAAEVGQSPSPSFVGYLRTLGGIITNRQFRIAKYSAAGTYLSNGFYRRFEWDPRLASNKKPPCYPAPDNTAATSQLQITNWWENVRFPEY